MSKQMKILTGLFGVLVLAAVVLTMFGKPPNLPLGPLQGMLVSDDETVDAAADTGIVGTTVPDPNCDPATGLPLGSTGTGAGATDPAAGSVADPAAGGAGTDTGTGTGAGTGTGTDAGAAGAATTDPATGQPVAASDGWVDGSRVVAAGDGSDASRVSDTWVTAADAVADPLATSPGAATDPAATTTDPLATDPAATGATAPDPGVAGTGTDPAASGTGTGTAVDPCADATGVAGGTGAGTGTDPLTGAAPGAGSAAGGAGAGAASAAEARATTDGVNNGNNAEALRAAKDASAVMQKAQITVSTTAALAPAAGGVGKPPALKRYRASVTAATLVMRLDEAAMQQWTSATKKVRLDLVKSFLTRLGTSYAKATRSVTVLDSSGTVIAIGDAAPGVKAGNVKLF